ncbi:hypothetical protein BKI52_18800 [marine bacterium AO1-C]|nr:hypothetical protein BKI52_18800 [marine bacterium AO1-C]
MLERLHERIKENIQSGNPTLDLHWTILEGFNFKLLSQCIHLQTLTLSCNDTVKQLDWIKPLKNLTELDLRSCKIYDISPLKDLIHLKSLDLNYNHFFTDFSALSNLTKLESLGLAGNRVSNISFLKPLKKLRKLDLDVNRITDLAPIEVLQSLEEISLVSNDVEDFYSLTKLGSLKKIVCDIERLPYPPIWYIYLKHKKGKLSDYLQLPELPQVQSIWRLLCSNHPTNLILAQQLATSQGWSSEDFEMYKNNRPREPEEDEWI